MSTLIESVREFKYGTDGNLEEIASGRGSSIDTKETFDYYAGGNAWTRYVDEEVDGSIESTSKYVYDAGTKQLAVTTLETTSSRDRLVFENALQSPLQRIALPFDEYFVLLRPLSGDFDANDDGKLDGVQVFTYAQNQLESQELQASESNLPIVRREWSYSCP